jgi:hypothetical protein
MIEPYLDDLEARIDPGGEDALWDAWVEFADGSYEGDLFVPARERKAAPEIPWPHVPINDALDDYEAMALQQFKGCSDALERGTGALMTVRCNYGTGIIPTLFGAEFFVMDRETDTLPTVVPLGGLEATNVDTALAPADSTRAAAKVRELLDQGIPDLHRALGGKVFEMAAYYQELMEPYPKIRKHVHLYHPDMQGPMDIAELLWGSALFMALIETPDLVTRLLELITETYIAFMNEWDQHVPFSGDHSVHWSMLHRGHIMLRDDSAMNLSPRMFDRFIKPYDGRLIREFGGGALHFCGRGDHYIDRVPKMEGVSTINMSQPEYNDMERIYEHTVDRGINIIGLPRETAEAALARGRDLHGRVHCWAVNPDSATVPITSERKTGR